MSSQPQASPKKSDAKATNQQKLTPTKRQSHKASPINISGAASQFETADKEANKTKPTTPPVDIGYVTFFPSAQEHE